MLVLAKFLEIVVYNILPNNVNIPFNIPLYAPDSIGDIIIEAIGVIHIIINTIYNI